MTLFLGCPLNDWIGTKVKTLGFLKKKYNGKIGTIVGVENDKFIVLFFGRKTTWPLASALMKFELLKPKLIKKMRLPLK